MRVFNGHLIHFTKGIGYFCGPASGRAMVVTYEGDLTACLEVVDAQDKDANAFVFGRFYPASKTCVIDWRKIRQYQQRHADYLPECKTCFARYTCAGGCAVKAVRESGDFFSKDIPYCTFTKAMVIALVQEIAQKSGI